MAETLTLEQIQQSLQSNPDWKPALLDSLENDFVPHVTAKGRIIRTKEEDETYVQTHVNAVVNERIQKELPNKINEEFGKTMTAIDQEIMSITGIEKLPNEKTTAYAKRVVEQMKTKGGDPVTKETVKQLQQQLETLKTESQTKLSQLQESYFRRENEMVVDAALGKKNIALPAHLKTDAEKQGFINLQKGLIKQGFFGSVTAKRDENGNTIYFDGETPLVDAQTGKPKTAEQIIEEKFAAWFVPSGHTVTGTGSQQPGGSTSGFTSKEDVHKYLASQGIDADSPEYIKEFERLCAEAKIKI